MLCGLRLTRVVGSGSLASASSIPAMICPRASASPAVQAGCARARTADTADTATKAKRVLRKTVSKNITSPARAPLRPLR